MEYNFTKQEILQAITYLDNHENEFIGRASSTYDLLHNGKCYPPILVLSKANQLKGNGKILLQDFNNDTRKAFKIFQDLGMEVVEKEKVNFSNYLLKFLDQSLTNNLKYAEFSIQYLGTKVKASFGQGSPAKIPWISFVAANNTTSQGIYPVYLYYKDQGLLILAYGVSETTQPSYNWQLDSSTATIKQVFKDKNIAAPYRYGDSFVFKVYQVDAMPSADVIDQDLNQLLNIYKDQLSNATIIKENMLPNYKQVKDFNLSVLTQSLSSSNLTFNPTLVTRFISSLVTKPFVILTGLSGSGKTKLAQSFIQWISESPTQYKIVPVGADWVNREPLLGYPNGLQTEQYVTPDNGVIDLMIEATKVENSNKPYFLVLDEMNLSHVERYFADFLSIMESEDSIKLYTGATRTSTDSVIIPSSIFWPKNLFIIGTVNIDETTYMFSPKVLDRANVIEFRLDESDLELYLNSPKEIDLKQLEQQGALMATSFLEIAKDKQSKIDPSLNSILIKFFKELKAVGAEFGYRSAYEINLLFTQFERIDPTLNLDQKVDYAIMQKLLPKLHGSRSKIVKPLESLMRLCLKDTTVFTLDQIDSIAEQDIKYKVCFEKLKQMYINALSNGFTSYAEA